MEDRTLPAPTSLDTDWADFVSKWFAGRAPLIPGERAWQALIALQRLWPERLQEALREGAVHPQTVARVIDDGVALASCEQLPGFAKVATRVREKEPGAASELRWAATLGELGYEVTLEPEVEGKHPDASILHEGEEICFEVSSPQLSEAIKEVWDATRTLALRLAKLEPPSVVDAYLTAEPGPNVADTIVGFLRSRKPDPLGATHPLPDIGFLRRIERGAERRDFNPAPDSSMFAEVGSMAGIPDGGEANVRTRVSDDRAQRLIDGELHHFSVKHTNIVVMDVSCFPRRIDTWAAPIGRRLQPSMNRRCGAVILLNVWTTSPPATVRMRSKVLKHPCPYSPVPTELIEHLENLPNWWGQQPTMPLGT
jgi:hypothetical protein